MDFQLHTDFPWQYETQWNQLLSDSYSHVPFLRMDYLSDWWATRGGGEWPDDSRLAIITASEEGNLIGIAPFFVVRQEGGARLLLLGSIEISDFLDVICRESDVERFCGGLLAFLRSTTLIDHEEVYLLDLYNILDGSPTIKALETAAEDQEFNIKVERLQHSPYIPLPGNWETYLDNLDKKQRHEIRRKMRRAEEGELMVGVYFTSEAARLEDDMEDFLELMAQDEEKRVFLSPLMRDQMKSTMRCAFQGGCLQLAFLEVGGQKAAAYLNFDYLNRIWVYNSGLDRSYMQYSPGWVLLGHLIKWATDNGREEFDFMRGDEDYKYKFGAVDRFVIRVTIDLKAD